MTGDRDRPMLYLAAPLFSQAELAFNRELAASLQPHFDVFLPQEDGTLLFDEVRAGTPIAVAADRIFRIDCEAIRGSEYLLAVLDGRSVDEGTAFELGMAFALKKQCYGFQTDPRRLTPFGNSPMLEGALSRIFSSRSSLMEWAEEVSGRRRTSHPTGSDVQGQALP
jgi:nucleoside 2-deoxyribosyltransferase